MTVIPLIMFSAAALADTGWSNILPGASNPSRILKQTVFHLWVCAMLAVTPDLECFGNPRCVKIFNMATSLTCIPNWESKHALGRLIILSSIMSVPLVTANHHLEIWTTVTNDRFESLSLHQAFDNLISGYTESYTCVLNTRVVACPMGVCSNAQEESAL